MKPIIAINFKTYLEGTGENALILAKKIEKLKIKYGDLFEFIVAVQTADIFRISRETNIIVFGQHFDPIAPDRNTGFISINSLIAAGAKGSLLNHSEHKMRIDELEEAVKIAKNYEFQTMVCANDPLMVAAVASFMPTYIAYEPPELIAGDISVSEAKGEQITLAVKFLKNQKNSIPLLVGAGIKKKKDLSIALKLGANGILVSSGIVKAKEPDKILEEWILEVKQNM
ncbi:MAG: triose-phosphate isomerase [Candidatus Woesearchaeota archaeon]